MSDRRKASPSFDLNDVASDYGPMVSSIARRMIQDPEVAKDAAQEVWVEICKSLPSFQGKSELSTWIYTIAKRVVLKYAKNERMYSGRLIRQFFERGGPEPVCEQDIEKSYFVKETCDRCLTVFLHCLNNEARLAFIFYDVAGFGYDEIARIFEKDENTIRQIVSRSRKRVKQFLNDECALYNPAGHCPCRMIRPVRKINLPETYQKIVKSVQKIRFFQAADKIFPPKNYWEKFL